MSGSSEIVLLLFSIEPKCELTGYGELDKFYSFHDRSKSFH